MALEPITRQEKIIAGQDLTPITRLEKFLKNFGGSGGGGGEQPNLSQTDSTKPDYIKGVIRQDSLPEGYPYDTDEFLETVLLEEQAFSGFAEGTGGYILQLQGETAPAVSLTIGKQYAVMWDGTEYITTAFNYNGFAAIGNPAMFDMGDDNGEPFSILAVPSIQMFMVATTDAGENHTIGVSSKKPISVKLADRFYNKPCLILNIFYNHYDGFYDTSDCNFAEVLAAYKAGYSIRIIFSGSGDGSYAECIGGYSENKLYFCGVSILDETVSMMYYVFSADGSFSPTAYIRLGENVVANAAGETPTAAEFNALLSALRGAGILASE